MRVGGWARWVLSRYTYIHFVRLVALAFDRPFVEAVERALKGLLVGGSVCVCVCVVVVVVAAAANEEEEDDDDDARLLLLYCCCCCCC